MSPLPISEVYVRENTSPQSYARGVSYFRSGSVISLEKSGDRVLAQVQGSEIDAYQVSFRLGRDSVTSAGCSCPYDWDDWCKHIVAALLEGLKAQSRPPPHGTIAIYLHEGMLDEAISAVGG